MRRIRLASDIYRGCSQYTEIVDALTHVGAHLSARICRRASGVRSRAAVSFADPATTCARSPRAVATPRVLLRRNASAAGRARIIMAAAARQKSLNPSDCNICPASL
jgi:hypothetical protein